MDDRIIFVVGSPRSGTTMMGLILGSNPRVHTFHEIHFFDKQWAPGDKHTCLSLDSARKLSQRLSKEEASKVHLIHRGRTDNRVYTGSVVDDLKPDTLYSHEIYRSFLMANTRENDKRIPCENTPGYIFYLDQILDLFPEARVISMVRDPRDVLLSQKYRWKLFYGSENTMWRNVFRTWMNYHPISTSRLWNAAVKIARRYEDHASVYTVRYEDILLDPEKEVGKICRFTGIDYDARMLEVSRMGSSIAEDKPDMKGIDKTRSANWKKGGLNSAELFLCQTINRNHMKRYQYRPVSHSLNIFLMVWYLMTFPVKLLISFMMHQREIKDIKEAVRRRLAW